MTQETRGVFTIDIINNKMFVKFYKEIIKGSSSTIVSSFKSQADDSKSFLKLSKLVFDTLYSEENKDVDKWLVNEDSYDMFLYIMSDSTDFTLQDVNKINDKNTYNKIKGNYTTYEINGQKYREFNNKPLEIRGVFTINIINNEMSIEFNKKTNANNTIVSSFKSKADDSKSFLKLSKLVFDTLYSKENKDVDKWLVNEDSYDMFIYIMSESYEFTLHDVFKINDKNTYNKIKGNYTTYEINGKKYREFNKKPLEIRGVFTIDIMNNEMSIEFNKKTNSNNTIVSSFKSKANDSKSFLKLSKLVFDTLYSKENKDVDKWLVNEDSYDMFIYIMSESYEFTLQDVITRNDKNTYNKNNTIYEINGKKYIEFNMILDKPNKEIFSYHTFLFPFRLMANSKYLKEKQWNSKGYFSKYCTKKIIDDLFKNSEHWKKDLIIKDKIEDLVCFKELRDSDNIIMDGKIERYQDLYRAHYKRLQYFHSAPLRAIYGTLDAEEKESDLLSQYIYRYNGKENQMELIIGVPKDIGGRKISKYYKLHLNDIRLKVYNTDIAIMVFEVENKKYTDLQDIMNINAFTRRVAVPNLNMDAKITPTYWGINILDDDNNKLLISSEDDIWKSYEMVLDKQYGRENIKISDISYTKIIDPIKELLSGKLLNEENRLITSNCSTFNKEEKDLFIEPALDDRMFVCSFIANDNLINATKSMYVEVDNEYQLWDDREIELKRKGSYLNLKSADKVKYGYQVDYQAAKDLYKVIYIDEKDSSCQSIHMIQQLFKESLYTRWIDWGTIQAITHHSYMMLSTLDCPDYLIDNHLELYVEMACMVLAQRASILQFQLFASELTDGLIKENEKMNQERINQLLNLQERYIAFQNQLLFFEVSSEEQAIELYEMLFKALYIKEENEGLSNQLQSLYEATNVNQDLNFNFYAALVAIITVILTAISFAHEAKDIVDIVYPHILTADKLSVAQWEEGFLRFFRWGLLWVAFVFIVSWITYRISLWLYNIYEKKLSIESIFKTLKDIFKRRS